MAKPDKPLLSLGAKGTIGDALTFQKRGKGVIVRTKPIPRDPYTLAQAYQRWDYQDYVYLWTLQSEAVKQTYRTRASRYHITGFSLWMREHLKDLPDLAGRWHLDRTTGVISRDTSKNENHAVIIGASSVGGLIDGSFLFDGLNDTLRVPHSPTLSFGSGDLSIDLFLKTTADDMHVISKRRSVASWEQYSLFIIVGGTIRLTCYDGVNNGQVFSTAPVNDGDWHHIVGRRKGADFELFIDGYWDAKATNALVGNLDNLDPLYISSTNGATYWYDGQIDHIAIYNRALDEVEILIHSERRYPP